MVLENVAVDQEETASQKAELDTLCQPLASPVKKKSRQFKIDIFQDWCKACGICVAFCSHDCLTLDEESAHLKADSDRCTGCGWCEIHCPDFAISVREEKRELSETDVEDAAFLETPLVKSA